MHQVKMKPNVQRSEDDAAARGQWPGSVYSTRARTHQLQLLYRCMNLDRISAIRTVEKMA